MTKTFPTVEENPRGLHQRYKVEKLYGDQDPDAVYFVLRLDKRGDDTIWTSECRVAARGLAIALMGRKHLREVAEELYKLCEELGRE